MIVSEEPVSGGVALRFTLESRPEHVSDALRAVRGIVERGGHVPPQDDTWELVVAEVLNNIVEHAYSDSREGEIHVVLEFRPTCLRAAFTDFGRAMPDHAVPEGAVADLNVTREALPEGGFGWFLIRSLTSDLSYRHVDGANHLNVEMPLARTA